MNKRKYLIPIYIILAIISIIFIVGFSSTVSLIYSVFSALGKNNSETNGVAGAIGLAIAGSIMLIITFIFCLFASFIIEVLGIVEIVLCTKYLKKKDQLSNFNRPAGLVPLIITITFMSLMFLLFAVMIMFF